jgi:hypothetical protein
MKLLLSKLFLFALFHSTVLVHCQISKKSNHNHNHNRNHNQNHNINSNPSNKYAPNYTGHRVYGVHVLKPLKAPASFEVFQQHMFARQPLFLRYETLHDMDIDLGWSTYKWMNLDPEAQSTRRSPVENDYLVKLVGGDTELQVEVDWTYYEHSTMNSLDKVPPNNVSNSFRRLDFGPMPTESTEVSYGYQFQSSFTTLTFSTFMKWYYNDMLHPEDPIFYLNIQKGDDGVYPPLLQLLDSGDIQLPYWMNQMGDEIKWDSANIWMGRSSKIYGTTSKMHCDNYDNLYYMLGPGTKKMILISPTSAKYLHTYGTVKGIHPLSGEVLFHEKVKNRLTNEKSEYYPHFSNIDPWMKMEDILKENSNYKYIEGMYILSVKPGDVVFIPSGWFHSVRSFGNTMAINFWFLHEHFARENV